MSNQESSTSKTSSTVDQSVATTGSQGEPNKESNPTEQKTAGAFDIRNMIALLLGLFGIFLLFSWIAIDPGVNIDTGEPKNAGYNLVTGLCLVAASVLFVLWAHFRPIRVDAEAMKLREQHHQEMEAERAEALVEYNRKLAGTTGDHGE